MRSSVVSVSALRRNISRQQSATTTIPRPDVELNSVFKYKGSNPDEPFQRSLRRRKRGRPFLVRAKWYSIVFFIIYLFPVIATVTHLAGMPHSTTILVLVRIFNPLQGALNILVFTRPHVAKELSRNSNLSWWGAFKKVIKSGGDDGDERTNRLRRGSLVPVAVPC